MSGSFSGGSPITREFEVATPAGTARVELVHPATPAGLVVLGHSAGGDSQAPLLVRVRDSLAASSFATALVDQPYRVAGRRLPDRAERLDEAMLAILDAIDPVLRGLPLVLGGKSSGARVGCRIARPAGAVAVVALGFPLTPPGGSGGSRAHELDAGCPVLVVQGDRDAFGGPVDVLRAAGELPVHVL
ncbi:MAG: alpha/beta family hydrolase [Mycobacteriales bacterium]